MHSECSLSCIDHLVVIWSELSIVTLLIYISASLRKIVFLPILIIASASADKSAAKYSEMSAFLGHIRPRYPSLGWRLTFKVVDTLTGSSSLAGRPFEEQPHELYRKWKVYTGN